MRYACHSNRLLCLLILFASLSGCGASNVPETNATAEIEVVLAATSKAVVGAQSSSEMVQRMRAIDLSDCPLDFRMAFVAHIHAVELIESLERDFETHNARYDSWGAFIEAFLRGMVFDFGMAKDERESAERLQRRAEEAMVAFRDTFHDLERIAVAHGARLPPRD